MAEDSSVPFVPNCPGYEHGKGGHGSTIRNARIGALVPPREEGILKVPVRRVQMRKPILVNEHPPKPQGEAAFGE